MKKKILFAYDFSHSKSVDFIKLCNENKIRIDLIVAAPFKKLNKPNRIFNYHKYSETNHHPRDLAKEFNIPYFVYDHNSLDTVNLIKEFDLDLGIIAGARILNKNIIKNLSFGVLNLHPGILPQSRGLDSILWSIHNNNQLGVSAHLINHKIDSGKLVLQKKIKPLISDSIFDLYRKIYKTQIEILPEAISLICKNNMIFKNLNGDRYHSYMSEEIQKKTINNLKSYIANYSKIT